MANTQGSAGTTWVEESPEPAGRSEVPDAGNKSAAEKQEKFVGDEVWLKNTAQGTITLEVKGETLQNKKWFLQLQLPGEDHLYNNGTWYSQKKVTMAKKGPRHN